MTAAGEQPVQIAIDGFVATGKSTIGELVAQRLGILYLDTGVMYRAVAFEVLDQGISPTDADACARCAATLDLRIMPPTVADGRQATILLGSRDVTWEIRTQAVNAIVSRVAAHDGVRSALRAAQRAIAATQPVVMVGRDIASVVLPDARVKIVLVAALETRVARRAAEIAARGQVVDRDLLREDIARRDREDALQMQQMPDTVIVATDDLSVDQVVERILEVVHERYP